ncbi:MAG TPA: nitrilase family protein [Planctomycetaceae bacterium]|nr:nitrilase family protein [Planctomycetaceae bacterium]
MRDIRIAAAQFEHHSGEKARNLERIRALTRRAVEDGAEIVSFHECSITAYTFVQTFSKAQLAELAEPVPDGPSVRRLIEIAAEFRVPVLAGLFERDGERLFNTYVCVTGDGLVAKFRKLHAFVNPHLSSGGEFCVFDLLGCRFGILICYDNNLPENVRITTLLGAEVIFMPHVTGCLPSPMPGRGTVDPQLWHNRERDPVPLRLELNGPKGRGWLMRWLPARAWENGVYAVFTNPIGLDDGQVRNGNAMILDPYGEVLCECTRLGDDVAVGLCTAGTLPLASGRRYLRARRPDLYGKLVEPPSEPPVTTPGWNLRRDGA